MRAQKETDIGRRERPWKGGRDRGREGETEGGRDRDIRERPEDNVQQVLMFKHQAAAGCHRASVTARVTERRSALL